MFEHRSHPLLSRGQFLVRQAQRIGFGILLIAAALGIGMVGYHWLEGLSWTDSFLNASMILSGMGPADALKNGSAKIFAGFYALFSGLAIITIAAVMLAPAVHRFLHRFHLEKAEEAGGEGNSQSG